MSALADLPAWAALPIAIAALVAALFAFVGSLGLLRLKTFYARVHAPTLGSTLGLYLMLAAGFAASAFGPDGFAWRLILIGAAVIVTTPISLLLLVRAATARDAAAQNQERPTHARKQS